MVGGAAAAMFLDAANEVVIVGRRHDHDLLAIRHFRSNNARHAASSSSDGFSLPGVASSQGIPRGAIKASMLTADRPNVEWGALA